MIFRKNSRNFPNFFKALGLTTAVFVLTANLVSSTESVLSDKGTVTSTSKADVIIPPTTLKLSNVTVGQTNLSWTASASTYATGYAIYRSTAAYGPWTLIGNVSGRTTTSYVDQTSGATSYFYRVEAKFANWLSKSTSAQAPPAVGLSFYDSFEGPSEDLDGRITQDKTSTWQLWSGYARIGGSTGTKSAYGTNTPDITPENGDVVVVRTPVHDGWMYGADFDGFERIIIRGKDSRNFLYVGGNNTSGSLDIGEVRNDVLTVLKSATPGTNQNIRVQVQGSTIKVYTGATRGSSTDGTLILSHSTTFLQADTSATYFGIGFTRGGYGIDDFTFEAY